MISNIFARTDFSGKFYDPTHTIRKPHKLKDKIHKIEQKANVIKYHHLLQQKLTEHSRLAEFLGIAFVLDSTEVTNIMNQYYDGISKFAECLYSC